jgi:hypothetical protein
MTIMKFKTDDWIVFVWDGRSALVDYYVTELWPEWLDYPDGTPVPAMAQHIHNHSRSGVCSLPDSGGADGFLDFE